MNSSLDRRVFNTIFAVLYAVGVAGFTAGLGSYLQTLNGDKVGPFAFSILAVLYGFSALVYNRARALPDGAEQRRSLYAAERSLQAAVLYLVGIILAIAIHIVFTEMGRTPTSLQHVEKIPRDQFFAFLIPVFIVAWSWATFYFGLRAMAHRFFRWQRPVTILRRLR